MRSSSASVARQNSQDLAFLALSTAIQLKKLRRDPDADTAAIDRFVEVLARTPGLDQNMDIRHLARDPEAISLYSNAFRSAANNSGNVIDSIHKLSSLLTEIKAPNEQARREAQEKMRKFCLALHAHILATRHPTEDLEHTFA